MTPVPDPKDVRELLVDLLGRPAEVAVSDPYAPEPREFASFAAYVDRGLQTRLVAVADLAFSAYAGAAIGLVPPAVAKDAVTERDISPMLRENLYEVLNICASLLNADGVPHVRLHGVHYPGEPVPHDLQAFACVLGRRLDLQVSIPGYGDGRLSFVGLL